MKRKTCFLLSFLMLASLAGCTAPAGELQDWQGLWYDVNGDTVLELKGNKLTVSWGEWSDEYTVHLETDGDLKYINSDQDYAFGIMSKLQVYDDGSLHAYEQVMDARGHQYFFVRKEALAGEREIRDESTDMPKTIESRDIERFSLSLFISHGNLGIDESWPSGYFTWELEKREDGKYKQHVFISSTSYIALSYDSEEDEAFARGLADRITELDIPAVNGYYKTNNVDSYGYSLYVNYASGEKLRVGADGDAAAECPFDVNGLMEYIREDALANSIH